MGKTFSSSFGIECTSKAISYCMWKALNLQGYFKEDESDIIKPKDLALVIMAIDSMLYPNELSEKIIKTFKFYDSDKESEIKENLKQANILFKDILVYAIAYDKKISVSYF